MHTYETIIYDRDDKVAIITLNRPERRNAINTQLIKEVGLAIDEVESNADIRVIIFTGGDKTFCSGVDLTEPWNSDTSRMINDLFTRIDTFPKPTIAAINGYALGGGCELALCCDFRVASETASIGTPEIKVGTIPSIGATVRLPQLIGTARAKELLLTGNPINGAEAYNIGLVNKVTKPEKALDEAKNLALTLADRPPLSLKAVKECIRAAMQLDAEDAINFSINSAEGLRGTEDYKEGRSAFKEKRKPVWKGQ
ncbi:enoyl-CoA hydratase/isomerase family protein [Chloroflexota bacterium]